MTSQAMPIEIRMPVTMVGAAAGSTDLLQPLRGITGAIGGEAAATRQQLVFRRIKGRDGLQLALDDSIRQGRNSMLDFYADWCIACKEMEKYAFSHADVVAALDQVNALQAEYGGGALYRFRFDGRIARVGVEGLRLVSTYQAGAEESDEVGA